MQQIFVVDNVSKWKDNICYSHIQNFLTQSESDQSSSIPFFVFDCEGSPQLAADAEEGTLCIFQFCYEYNNTIYCCVVDVFICPELLFEDDLLLRPLLQHPKIYKWIHDGRKDCEALFFQMKGITVQGILDTQYMFHQLIQTIFVDSLPQSKYNPIEEYVYPLWYRTCLFGSISQPAKFFALTFQLWTQCSVYSKKAPNKKTYHLSVHELSIQKLANLICSLCVSHCNVQTIEFFVEQVIVFLIQQCKKVYGEPMVTQMNWTKQVKTTVLQLFKEKISSFKSEWMQQNYKNIIYFIHRCIQCDVFFFNYDELYNIVLLILECSTEPVAILQFVANSLSEETDLFDNLFEKYQIIPLEKIIKFSYDKNFYFIPDVTPVTTTTTTSTTPIQVNKSDEEMIYKWRHLFRLFHDISLVKLVNVFCGIDYANKNEFRDLLRSDSQLWKSRPLQQVLIDHASCDVIYLMKFVQCLSKLFHLFGKTNVQTQYVIPCTLFAWSTCAALQVLQTEKETQVSKDVLINEEVENTILLRILWIREQEARIIFGKAKKLIAQWKMQYKNIHFVVMGSREPLAPRNCIFCIGPKSEIHLFCSKDWNNVVQKANKYEATKQNQINAE